MIKRILPILLFGIIACSQTKTPVHDNTLYYFYYCPQVEEGNKIIEGDNYRGTAIWGVTSTGDTSYYKATYLFTTTQTNNYNSALKMVYVGSGVIDYTREYKNYIVLFLKDYSYETNAKAAYGK